MLMRFSEATIHMSPLTFSPQELRPFNTLSLPGSARLAYLKDSRQLEQLGQSPAAKAGKLFILGGGSNIIAMPQPQHLIVKIATRGIRLHAQTSTHWIIQAQAGESWHGFVGYCLQQGWAGLENLALIPGTVGAAPVQNIGAYGVELQEYLHAVECYELASAKRHLLAPADCGFGYRDSIFKRAGAGAWLIASVFFALPKTWQARLSYPDLQNYPGLTAQADARQVYAAICAIRAAKLPDPALLPNAGSFFKNPVVSAAQARQLQAEFPGLRAYAHSGASFKLAAGWLIEQAGWKGRSLGPVGMHAQQALVLVNHGGASASDVLGLAERVQQDVERKFGVRLEREPVLLD